MPSVFEAVGGVEVRNRILSITRNTIPYVKEIRSIAGSVTASILMQQLDYWFERYPNGFYKFLEPCEHELYKAGCSWTEELGFSKEEFRSAFAHIGTQHKSKSQFNKAEDCFAGKFYCSYFDRIKGVVYYFRNHELVDQALDSLSRIPVNRESQFTEMGNPNLQRSGIPIYGNGQPQFTEIGNPNLHSIYRDYSRDYSDTSSPLPPESDEGVKKNGHTIDPSTQNSPIHSNPNPALITSEQIHPVENNPIAQDSNSAVPPQNQIRNDFKLDPSHPAFRMERAFAQSYPWRKDGRIDKDFAVFVGKYMPEGGGMHPNVKGRSHILNQEKEDPEKIFYFWEDYQESLTKAQSSKPANSPHTLFIPPTTPSPSDRISPERAKQMMQEFQERQRRKSIAT